MTAHALPFAPRPLAAPASRSVPVVLFVAAIACEIATPLVTGRTLDILTIVTVVTAAAAVTAQLGATSSWRHALLMLGITAGAGFLAEVVGVHSGIPFGSYAYSSRLGVMVAGVPLVIPFAWVMLAWPALCVGRLIGSPILGGGAALATWDLFLDPQMVANGYWSWKGSGPRLNGIPLVNHLGWLLVAILLCAALDRAIPARSDSRLLLGWWLWTYASSVLANLAFFGRPGVALSGGVGMGVVAVLLVRRLA